MKKCFTFFLTLGLLVPFSVLAGEGQARTTGETPKSQIAPGAMRCGLDHLAKNLTSPAPSSTKSGAASGAGTARQ